MGRSTSARQPVRLLTAHVLRSGSEHLGTWQEETVNVYRDYQAAFGEEPGEVQGIAVNTSSDSTKSVAAADYDDFTLHTIEDTPQAMLRNRFTES